MRIILARHGNTFVNSRKTFWIGAREDLPLTVEGRQQALWLGRALDAAGISPAAVFCGPLRRTHEYATIALLPLEPGPVAIVDERLREIDYGAWGGLSSDEITRRFGRKELADWQQSGIWPSNADWRPGEQQVMDGVRSLLAQVTGGFHAGDSVVLITSNGILRFFLKYLVTQHGGRIDVGNGKVATGNVCDIRYGREGYEIISWNVRPDAMCGLSERAVSASPAA